MQTLELHSHRGGDVLRFRLAGFHLGRPVYRHAGCPDLGIAWDKGLGWVSRDPVTGALTGRSWEVPRDRQGALPPQGTWVSLMGETPHVYDLVHA